MPDSIVILVRIADRVPRELVAAHDPECHAGADSCDEPFVAPLVTTEMAVFFRQRPDAN